MDLEKSERLIAMNKNLKILAGTVVLAFSAIAIAPAQAEYNNQESQTPSQSQSVQSQKRLGQVVSVSGSTAEVEMSNGMTKTVEFSSSDMEGMTISQGSYVVISDNQITGVAQVGTIKAMTGSLADVELEDGETKQISVSRAEIGAMNLIEGTQVYVADDEIIAAARGASTDTMSSPSSTDGTMQSQSESMEPDSTDTTGGTGTRVQQGSDTTGGGSMGGTQTQEETAPTNNQSGYTGQDEGTGTQTQDGAGGVYNTQPQTGTETPDGTGPYNNETDTQTPSGTGTYESQPETDTQTQESEEPVRGMW
jgi:hypothetical protein